MQLLKLLLAHGRCFLSLVRVMLKGRCLLFIGLDVLRLTQIFELDRFPLVMVLVRVQSSIRALLGMR